MYELAETRKIEVVALGETTTHVFRELSAEEFLRYRRSLASALGGSTGSPQAEKELAHEAKLWLGIYDSRIERVEGYSYQGEDLMQAKPDDWKDFIPGDHKVRAVEELLFGAALKKKSETASASSPAPKKPVRGRKNAAST